MARLKQTFQYYLADNYSAKLSVQDIEYLLSKLIASNDTDREIAEKLKMATVYSEKRSGIDAQKGDSQ